MTRNLVIPCVVFVCAGLAMCQEPTVAAVLANADKLQAAGQPEAAAEQMRLARTLVDKTGDAKLRRKQLATIRSKMGRIDPLHKRLQKQREQSAKARHDAGVAYLEKGWNATALPLLQAAELLVPGIAAGTLATAKLPMLSAAAAAAAKGMRAFFADAEDYGAAWQLDEVELVSPPVTDQSLMYMSRKSLRGDCRLACDIRVGPGPAKVALVFGHNLDWQRPSFYFFEIFQRQKDTVLRVFANDADDTKLLLGQKVVRRTPEQRAGWLQVSVELRGDAIHAKLGDLELGPFQAKGAKLPGAGGFYISSDTQQRGAVRFRRMRSEEL